MVITLTAVALACGLGALLFVVGLPLAGAGGDTLVLAAPEGGHPPALATDTEALVNRLATVDLELRVTGDRRASPDEESAVSAIIDERTGEVVAPGSVVVAQQLETGQLFFEFDVLGSEQSARCRTAVAPDGERLEQITGMSCRHSPTPPLNETSRIHCVWSTGVNRRSSPVTRASPSGQP